MKLKAPSKSLLTKLPAACNDSEDDTEDVTEEQGKADVKLSKKEVSTAVFTDFYVSLFSINIRVIACVKQ